MSGTAGGVLQEAAECLLTDQRDMKPDEQKDIRAEFGFCSSRTDMAEQFSGGRL